MSVCELCGFVCALVHCGHEGDEWVGCCLKYFAACCDVVAVEPNHEWLVCGVAEFFERTDDAVGDCVAGGDSTEDVNEHAFHLWVAEDHVESGRHDFC